MREEQQRGEEPDRAQPRYRLEAPGAVARVAQQAEALGESVAMLEILSA